MNEKLVSLNVDNEIITDIVKKKINAEIAKQWDMEGIVEALVSSAMKQKVNNQGKVSQYTSDNSYDFIEIITKKAIQEKAKEALHEFLAENAEKIKEAVMKELKNPQRQKSIAKAYLSAIENSLKCSWSMSCSINFTDKRY